MTEQSDTPELTPTGKILNEVADLYHAHGNERDAQRMRELAQPQPGEQTG